MKMKPFYIICIIVFSNKNRYIIMSTKHSVRFITNHKISVISRIIVYGVFNIYILIIRRRHHFLPYFHISTAWICYCKNFSIFVRCKTFMQRFLCCCTIECCSSRLSTIITTPSCYNRISSIISYTTCIII